jgi:phosphatidylglycerophosphatase A
MKRLWGIVASFFGIGFFPAAPGTVASLAVLLIYRFFLWRLPWPLLVGIFLALLVLGIRSSSVYAAQLGQEDPRRIVVDEAAGQLLVFLFVPPAWLNLGLGFLLFRFFDIVKPFPISRAERLPAGWGIMADDVAAAAAAKVILHLYLWLK